MISKVLAQEILTHALQTGAEYAEIYQQNNVNKNIRLSYRRVDSLATVVTCGIGIRINKGDQSVYGYTSDTSRKALVSLADSLAASYKGEPVVEVKELVQKKRKKPINKDKKNFLDVPSSEIIARLKSAEQKAYAVDPRIINVFAGISADIEDVNVYTSEGFYTKDHRSFIRAMLNSTARDDKGGFTNHSTAPGFNGGYDLFDSYDFDKLAVECSEMAIKKLSAAESPSGVMTVVIGNAFGGTLFHEACGHPLEAVSIAHNRSTYVGKLGQQIANPVVTAIDDGTIDNGWGSLNFDDEGNETTKNVLIEKGILKNYMVDKFNGKKLGLAPTGSERRQSYRYRPTTRMTNTYIDAGESTFDEIIGSVQYGLYCESFRGGSVDPSTNNFNFSSDTVYMIRDGKIAEMVKPVILVGFGYEILMKIDMVGNDLVLCPGMCGASSGSIPVQVGQPTVRITGITVGGSSKEGN